MKLTTGMSYAGTYATWREYFKSGDVTFQSLTRRNRYTSTRLTL